MLLTFRSIALAALAGSLAAANDVDPLRLLAAAEALALPSHSSSGPVAPDGCLAIGWHGYYGGTFASVRWNDESDDEDGFIVEWRGSGVEGTIVLPADTTEVNGLPCAKGYRYRVRAFNASGLSAWSSWARPQFGGAA